MKLLAVAGEASGDAHGGALLAALRDRLPELSVEGIGGPRMLAAGLEPLFPLSDLQVHGLIEVVAHLPRLYRVLGSLRARLRETRPDAVLLIDYPGFNLKLARAAHDLGVPVITYCGPQIWAWRRGRLHVVARNVDKLIVLFPFEVEFYRAAGVDAEFLGHPLVGVAAPQREVQALQAALAPRPGRRIVAVMPGSRPSELARNLPTMLAGLALARDAGLDAQFVLPLAPGLKRTAAEQAVAASGLAVDIAPGAFLPLLQVADLAVAASGTATLQLAMAGLPGIVVYRVAPPTYWLARRLSYVQHISIVNILAGHELLPELLQNDFTPTRVRDTLLSMANSASRLQEIRAGLAQVAASLGEPGAYGRAAESMAGFLRARTAQPA
jgi:lipid-A-disaccharide synthase